MKVTGPDTYTLKFNAKKFTVTCKNGTGKFSGLSTSKYPKLYVVSVHGKPIYVGITKQSMRSRLRMGWAAQGEGGYYGYAWRRKHRAAKIDIWCHQNPLSKKPLLDIETIEAEVVYLIRSAGQWPPYQTEIHFHKSKAVHRKIAAHIAASYDI